MHIRFAGVEVGCRVDDGFFLSAYTPPTTEIESDVTDRLGADGVAAGRDWLRSSTWSFVVQVRSAATPGVLERAEEFERAWKAKTVRSGGMVALEYSTDHGVTWYRVCGRPRRFTGPLVNYMAARGYGRIDCQFEQLDPLHYSVDEHSSAITSAVAVSSGGWLSPFVFPLSSVGSGEDRAGAVVNAGDHSSPLKVTFYGPCRDPKVYSDDGQEAGYVGEIRHGERVTIDARNLSVTLGSRPVPGRVTSKTFVEELTVRAGRSDWWFSTVDDTGTARAVLSWSDAHTSLQ